MVLNNKSVNKKQDSRAGVTTAYGLNGRGSIPVRGKIFLPHSVQTGSMVHPTFHPMGTGCSFPEGKAVEA
jgi:hypothetical protein